MSRIAYVVKVYPRFSETFIVTEILAREAQGESLNIYALRPTTDARFHPELARVQAPVSWIPRYPKSRLLWERIAQATSNSVIAENFMRIMPQLRTLPGDEVGQAMDLAEKFIDDQITHIHAHFASLSGRIAWIASQLTGIGFSVTTHAKDLYHQDVDPVWLKRICSDADNVIAISQYNEAFLKEFLQDTGANITLQYNALELDRFPFSPETHADNGVLKVAAVGRLVEKKGFHHLIEAVRGLDNIKVKIAGTGEWEEQLRTQAVDTPVEFIGPQTQAQIRELLCWADVFVAPCIPGEDGNIDGLPTVVLEAMAVGTPVIATSVTGLPEVVRNGETGILLAPGDVEGLRHALNVEARDHVPLSRYARNARALIENQFDSTVQASNLRKLQVNKQ